jgi:hypothetical protein
MVALGRKHLAGLSHVGPDFGFPPGDASNSGAAIPALL